jgi:hypothetical protein
MQQKPPAEPEPLILPRGVRFPFPNELPALSEAERTRIGQARVTTGYRLLPGAGNTHAAFFEANVHALNLYAVFYDLALTVLPRIVVPILAVNGDTYTGRPTSRAAALKIFEPHTQPFQHDGLLAFGLICERDGVTEQVFVPPSKHLQVWVNEPAVARSVFARHRIPEVPDLQLMDQYPLIREALETPEGNPSWPQVLESVRAAFATLPPPDR